MLRQEKKTQQAMYQSVTIQKDMLKSMLESSSSNINESMEVIEQPQVRILIDFHVANFYKSRTLSI